MAKRTTKNFIFYQGPSALDGAAIVAIATFNSSNGKTGDLVQTWIMRSDIDPRAASKRGLDVSICGDCRHRGLHDGDGLLIGQSRTCYVQLRNAPRGIWGCYRRGGYPTLTTAETRARFAGLKVRLGSYGDPAAVPFHVWAAALGASIGNTGYTHQWRRAPELAQWCMASVDNLGEMLEAKLLGFRTFRVGNAVIWHKQRSEVLCPASAEAGHKTSCVACMACGGSGAKARADIVIPAHGASKRRVVG